MKDSKLSLRGFSETLSRKENPPQCALLVDRVETWNPTQVKVTLKDGDTEVQLIVPKESVIVLA